MKRKIWIILVVSSVAGIFSCSDIATDAGRGNGKEAKVRPRIQTVNCGEPVEFVVDAAGVSTPFTIQWQFKDHFWTTYKNLEGKTGATLRIAHVPRSWDGYVFRAEINTNGNLTYSSEAGLWVECAPLKITEHPHDQKVCEGGPVVFEVGFSSGTPEDIAFQWQVEGEQNNTWRDIEGATSEKLEFTAALQDQGSFYRVIVSDSCKVKTSKRARLIMKEVPKEALITPSSLELPIGQLSLFIASMPPYKRFAAQPLEVQWQISEDGGVLFEDIEGAIRWTLLITGAAEIDRTMYRAIMRNECGADTTNIVTVDIIQ